MLKLSSTTITIFAVILVFGLLFFSCFLFQPEFAEPELVIKEEPLEKNVVFQIQPGETYRYLYQQEDTLGVNLTYEIMKGPNCTFINLVEDIDSPGICVDTFGMDKRHTNSAFQNNSVIMFKPWMLALHENWKWNTSVYLELAGESDKVADTSYRVVRTENYKGRECFVVEIKVDDVSPEYQWIDVEKRFLVRTLGIGYVVELLEEID